MADCASTICDGNCSICGEPLSGSALTGGIWIPIECEHQFHVDCLKDFLFLEGESPDQCPLCMTQEEETSTQLDSLSLDASQGSKTLSLSKIGEIMPTSSSPEKADLNFRKERKGLVNWNEPKREKDGGKWWWDPPSPGSSKGSTMARNRYMCWSYRPMMVTSDFPAGSQNMTMENNYGEWWNKDSTQDSQTLTLSSGVSETSSGVNSSNQQQSQISPS